MDFITVAYTYLYLCSIRNVCISPLNISVIFESSKFRVIMQKFYEKFKLRIAKKELVTHHSNTMAGMYSGRIKFNRGWYKLAFGKSELLCAEMNANVMVHRLAYLIYYYLFKSILSVYN